MYFNIIHINVAMKGYLNVAVFRVKVDHESGGIGITDE